MKYTKRFSYVCEAGGCISKKLRAGILWTALGLGAAFGYLNKNAQAQDTRPDTSQDAELIVKSIEAEYEQSKQKTSEELDQKIQTIATILFTDRTLPSQSIVQLIQRLAQPAKNPLLRESLAKAGEEYQKIMKHIAETEALVSQAKNHKELEKLYRTLDGLEAADQGSQYARELLALAQKVSEEAKKADDKVTIYEFNNEIQKLEQLVKELPEKLLTKQAQLREQSLALFQTVQGIIKNDPELTERKNLEQTVKLFTESYTACQDAERLIQGEQFKEPLLVYKEELSRLKEKLDKMTAEETKKPEPAQPEPPKPDVQPKKPEPAQPEPPKKPEVPPQPQPSTPTPTPAQPEKLPGVPAKEINRRTRAETAVSSNRTTKAHEHYATLTARTLDFRGFYGFSEWKNQQEVKINQMQDAGYLEFKPMSPFGGLAELLGIDVSESFLDFLDASACFDRTERREREFASKRQITSEFDTTTDTATKVNTNNEFYSVLAALKAGAIGARFIPHYEQTETEATTDVATYHTNLANPDGNYATSIRIKNKIKIISRGIDAAVELHFDKEIPVGNKIIPVKGFVRARGDYTQIKQRTSRTDILEDTLVRMESSLMLSKFIGLSGAIQQELFNGIGDKEDGWRSTRGFGAIVINPGNYIFKNAQDELIMRLGAAFWLIGWNGENDLPGSGAGALIRIGGKNDSEINATNLNDAIYTIGRCKTGMMREMGDTLAALEQRRGIEDILLNSGNGFNLLGHCEVFQTRTQHNQVVRRGAAYFGLGLKQLALMLRYIETGTSTEMGGDLYALIGKLKLFAGFEQEFDKFKRDKSKTGKAGFELSF